MAVATFALVVSYIVVTASRAAVTAATAAGPPTTYSATGEMAMHRTVIALALVLAACNSRPPAAPPADSPRPAIDIKYVGVVSMKIYAEPMEVAPLVATYGYTETVSILARKGDWVEVRTVDGSGWARASDLIGAEQV
jgi:Bacterial SH3 domain